jgi:FkbM family methyltransferase
MRKRRKRFKDIKLSLRVAGLSGLFCAIKGMVTNSEVILNMNREDVISPIRLRVPSSDISVYEQIYINQDYDFLVETPPKVIIDAGANIGLASVYFANKYPGATIIAIEPGRDNFELLKRNVESYRNVIPLHSALWNKNETLKLVDPGLGHWGFMTEGLDVSGKTSAKFSHTVHAITLGKIMADYHLETIDILKIDIEGAEKEVFEDSSAWIGKVKSVIIELHEDMKSGCNRNFYNGTNGFDDEWKQGENVYLAKGKYLTRRLEK